VVETAATSEPSCGRLISAANRDKVLINERLTKGESMRSSIIFVGIAVGVLACIVTLALFVARRNELEMRQEQKPQGYWMSIGISLGLFVGMAGGLLASILTGEESLFLPIGPGAGLAVGVGIGSFLENKHKDELRPVNETETKRQRLALLVGLGILFVVGVVAALLVATA